MSSAKIGKTAFTRDTYNRIRKMDRRSLQVWLEQLYTDGYQEGYHAGSIETANTIPPLDVEAACLKSSQIKGIGSKKLDAIREALDGAIGGGAKKGG